MKPIKLRVTKEELIDKTILIFSGFYKLTDLESKILASIIKYYLDLTTKIKDASLLHKNFMDSTHRAILHKEFDISPPGLTKYLNNLKNKKVLKEENGIYYIDKKFLPSTKIIFEFEVTE
jgi:hypothetical protein